MGMRPPKIYVPIFINDSPGNILLSFLCIKALMEGLCKANCAFLKLHPETPGIYDKGIKVRGSKVNYVFTGVKYEPEMSAEDWLSIPYIIAIGHGDCEDLACWRAAELRMKYGIQAKPDMRARKMPTGQWRAHAIVRLPDGRTEDPSAKLGMKTVD